MIHEYPLNFFHMILKAPEIIRNEGNYDHKVDIWSLGILAVELFNGIPPYYEIKNQWQVFNMIKKNGRPPAIDRWFDMSPELRDFLDKCLVVSARSGRY